MIDLQEYKTKRLSKFSQLLVLNHRGEVTQSCDAIFRASVYEGQSIVREIPLLESIFDVIAALPPDAPALLFSKVQSPTAALLGVYDFVFSKIIINDKPHILWFIYDFTALYKDLIDYQQRRNDLEIRRQQQQQQLLQIFNTEGRTHDVDYLKTMLVALRQNGVAPCLPFELRETLQSILDTFSHLPNFQITMPVFELQNKLIGDVTWLKYLLFNILDSVLLLFKNAQVQVQLYTNTHENDVFLNISFVFNGEVLKPQFVALIFNEAEALRPVSPDEQHLLAKLYSVQKIVTQQNGVLKIEKVSQNFCEVKILSVCNFTFSCNK